MESLKNVIQFKCFTTILWSVYYSGWKRKKKYVGIHGVFSNHWNMLMQFGILGILGYEIQIFQYVCYLHVTSSTST